MKPNLELYNHLGEGRLSSSVTDALIGALESCLPSVLALPEGPVPVLSGLDEVEISVVSDDVIRDVHARFLNDPTATDVITFPHGDGMERSSSALIPLSGRLRNSENLFSENFSGTWCMVFCICTDI